MPRFQVFILLTVISSLKSRVLAVPVPTYSGLIGGLVDDVLGVHTYTSQNDQNQKQTIFVTQYVTSPTSLAGARSHERSTLLVTSTITSYVQDAVGSTATATAAPSTATSELEANPTTTGMRQPEPSGDPLPYHGSSTRRINGPIVAGYYPDWASSSLSPEQVDWRAFDWVDFAFAIPDANFDLVFTQPDSKDLLRRLSSAAHRSKKHVKLSIGGWTGSAHFSKAVATLEARNKFSTAIAAAYDEYNLDGIDLDWEYCGVEGYAGNGVTPEDCGNFLKLLHTLRNKLPTEAVITAATRVVPFAGSNGKPMTDVSAFAKVLDWVMIMNYDTVGSSPTPGPNAPLWDKCRTSGRPESSARAAIEAWKAAGFPAKQLVLGLPSYGYIQRSTVERLQDRRAHHGRAVLRLHAGLPRRLRQATVKDVAPVLVRNGDGGTEDGQVHFSALVQQGALVKGGNTRHGVPVFGGGGGFERLWDTCSSTPWLRSKLTQQVITYDDPESLWMKGNLAKEYGLLGVSLFSIDGDDKEGALMASVRDGLGLKV